MSDATATAAGFGWDFGEAQINGAGFGNEPGLVKLTLYAVQRQNTTGELLRTTHGPSVEIHSAEFTVWRDDLIQFRAPESFVREADDFRAKTTEEFKRVNERHTLTNFFGYSCEVRTLSGEVATYPAIETRKPKRDRGAEE